VISAKPGGVNLVQGTVTVTRRNGSTGHLIKGDDLNIGDKVSTGPDGKAEILLNPGSFVRLGGSSVFTFKTTSLEDLQLELASGSAILEVFAAKEFQVNIATPKTKYVLIETGIYRVDVSADQNVRLRVWKGRARVDDSEDSIKGGRAAAFVAGSGIAIAKFDRDETDSLDDWSKQRGKDLAKASGLFERTSLRTSLMRSFLGRRWDMYNSFGLWVFNPYVGGSCFLPFGYGWNSPYGFGYGSYLGWYNLPQVIYYPPSPTTGGGNPTRGPVVTMDDPPPFQKMQRTMGGGVRGADGGRNGGSYDPNPSGAPSPTYSPAPAPAPVTMDPAPVRTVSPGPPRGVRQP
jgi:hypothetical protein